MALNVAQQAQSNPPPTWGYVGDATPSSTLAKNSSRCGHSMSLLSGNGSQVWTWEVAYEGQLSYLRSMNHNDLDLETTVQTKPAAPSHASHRTVNPNPNTVLRKTLRAILYMIFP